MNKYRVSIVKYRKKIKSVQRAIELSDAFQSLSGNERIFLKPNIVYWSTIPDFPKYGVVTTSRVVEDTIIALKERGISDITIGEGIVTSDPKDFEIAHHAFETLGYNRFKQKYGIKVINIMEQPFEKAEIGDGTTLNYNSDFLHSDFIVSLPVLKTHSQARVSLGIKNLKGLIDINSRKKCHSADNEKDLDFHLARLTKNLPPTAVIIDGIYTNERGPGFDGRMRRSNILIASSDIFSADKVGAKILGHDPANVPYLTYYADINKRPIDFSDVEIVGKNIESVQVYHEYKFPYNEDGSNPIAFEKQGIKGISYRQYDNTTCTYCSIITSLIPVALSYAWNGDPWDDVEIILGKRMHPNPGKRKTILLGQCMVNKHRDNPDINEMIPIKGCPAKVENIINAFHQAGIEISSEIFENLDNFARILAIPYKHRFNEFQESFFNGNIKDESVPPIDDIVVSQILFNGNNNSSNIPKKQAKFEIRFFGLAGEKSTNAIKNIVIEGPNGYEFKIKNQSFNFTNGNGYIIDKYNRNLIWYLAFDRNGFLNDGEYKITIDYWNGETRVKSRKLQTNDKLLKSYLEVKDKIKYSFEEIPKYMEDPRIYVRTKWTPLKELGGVNAYYANYVSEGKTDNINFHDLTYYDPIYLNSILMSSYGLNKSSALVFTRWKPLKPNTEYTWFTEICDANKYGNTNMTIYQPIQYFHTK
ncbi:MAG: DUF362 domain-containing protein [Candidatus Hodarchaeota archaeon]